MKVTTSLSSKALLVVCSLIYFLVITSAGGGGGCIGVVESFALLTTRSGGGGGGSIRSNVGRRSELLTSRISSSLQVSMYNVVVDWTLHGSLSLSLVMLVSESIN